MKAMYKITTEGRTLSEMLQEFQEAQFAKADYISVGYEDVKIVKVDVLQEYYNMKDDVERTKFNELEKEIIAKGILLYEKEWRKSIIKSNKEIEKQGRIPAMGEFLPKTMNHDIFIKLGVMRNTYNEFIKGAKIEE